LRAVTACALALVFAFTVGARINPVEAGPTYLRGIDVSKWQGAIDWPKVADDGIRFAIVRATYGNSTVDPWYATNREGADAAGLAFTAYHYATPEKTPGDAAREADHFVDTAQLLGRHLVPVLDLEDHNGLGPKRLRAWARAWLERVEERLGVKATIYTNGYFWRDRMGNSQWFANNGHRLWIAHWGASKPSVPAGNWAGNGWTLWQHAVGARGRVDGIDAPVDLNRFNGTDLVPLRINNND
jgi:GH25 family lysozyme M1 (1,4-beta-N-acetylmuramidase)